MSSLDAPPPNLPRSTPLTATGEATPKTVVAGAESPAWHLLGQTDSSGTIRKIPIHSTPFGIGRAADSALQLESKNVSKRHAEIVIRDQAIWLRDLQSTNGTYVNGERVSELVQLRNNDLVQFATSLFRVGFDEARTVGHTAAQFNASDQALAMIQFERLISEGGVIPYFQPIVQMHDRTKIAFEVLGRSRLFGLSTPREMFAAAHQLNQVLPLSEMFRSLGANTARLHKLETNLFLNTHPDEIGNQQLLHSLQALRNSYPHQAFTLEIHERAVTQCGAIQRLRATLDELSIQLAFDDFGQGETRLVELSEVNPHYIKFDRSLIQKIATASFERQKVLSVMAQMVNELGMVSLAEGVEEEEDHLVLQQMGFQLGQGFLYGKPLSITKYCPRTSWHPGDE